MTCDNCGNPVQDKDEILCRKCKPSLQREQEIKDCLAKIDAAYWAFCRQARANPPSMVCPEAYTRLKELGYHYLG